MSCGCQTPTPPPPSAPPNTCGSCKQTVYLRRYPTGCGCGQPKAQCSCHEPETPLCVPCGQSQPVCEPTRRAIKLHVTINPSDAGSCFPLTVCECGDPAPDITKLKAKIRRRGQCQWLIEYPAWDCSECGVEFRWDSLLYSLPKGRYELQFEYDCQPCGLVELRIGRPCPVNTGSYTAIKSRVSYYPSDAPPGAHPVFNDIVGFSATLCSVFDKPDTMLPLCPDDLSRLCAVTLCKAVELEVTDGTNSELVTFTGCTTGSAIVTRSSPRYKFPKGSTVRFVWSAGNAQAACSPCP